MELSANAKINLHLEITGRRSDGYHTVDTVMQEISISDRISLTLLPKSEGIRLQCNVPSVPCDARNIAYKAASKYLELSCVDCGALIILEKNIPHEAGLGGGSADGAAVLAGLNNLCCGVLDGTAMQSIAASLGADVPFFLYGGTALMGGIGTDFVERIGTPDFHLVIAKPPVGISTPAAYGYLDRIHNNFTDRLKTDYSPLINAIRQNSAKAISDSMYNVFETAADELCAPSKELRLFMREHSYGAMLSGSGSAVFAITDGRNHSAKLVDKLIREFPDCYVEYATTVNNN